MANPPAASATKPRSRIAAWFDHHVHSVAASLGRMLHKPWATLLTVGVMAVALALPLGLALVLDNVARLGGTVERAREASLFLKPDVPFERARALAQTLRARSDVAEVVVRSPDDGLASLRDGGATDVYAAAIAAVGENPLPSVLIVRPRGDEHALSSTMLSGASGWTAGSVSANARPGCWRPCWDSVHCWWWVIPCAWTSRHGGRRSRCCSHWAPPTDSFAGRSCIWARPMAWSQARWRWAC
jgi:FtsX extracellular domain